MDRPAARSKRREHSIFSLLVSELYMNYKDFVIFGQSYEDKD